MCANLVEQFGIFPFLPIKHMIGHVYLYAALFRRIVETSNNSPLNFGFNNVTIFHADIESAATS
jgi:hypothetical protein